MTAAAETATPPKPKRKRFYNDLSLQVLTYMEFTDSSIGRDTFLAYQKSKESLAMLAQPGSNVPGIRNLLPQ